MSNNIELVSLDCDANQLTNINVNGNTALTELRCMHNQLTALDVSGNTALTELRCQDNRLTALYISGNTALTTLYCDNNQLTELDVSGNTALEWLNCSNNQLTALDVSRNTELIWFSCYNNHLTSLDLRNNQNIDVFMGGNQRIDLSQISASGYDLLLRDRNIDGTRITNPEGATFVGTVMSGYSSGTPVSYTYDCDDVHIIRVILNFELLAGTSNIIYKDGTEDFNSWKTDYIAPSTYEEGTGVVLPTAENIAKEGYTFIGWYDNEELTGNPVTELDAAATGGISSIAVAFAFFFKRKQTSKS